MHTWKSLIDDAAEICGGQNALARRIGIDAKNLSAAKQGKKPLAKEHIKAIAELLSIDPGELWLTAQDARNPFREGIAAAILTGVFTALLTHPEPSTAQPSARAVTILKEAGGNVHCHSICYDANTLENL